MQTPLEDTLEHLVDQHGMYAVLSALAKVADAKAEHVAVNWQDVPQAKAWARTALAIDLTKERLTRHIL